MIVNQSSSSSSVRWSSTPAMLRSVNWMSSYHTYLGSTVVLDGPGMLRAPTVPCVMLSSHVDSIQSLGSSVPTFHAFMRSTVPTAWPTTWNLSPGAYVPDSVSETSTATPPSTMFI